MDHDAMLTHVNKLKQFRDDFLVLSRTTPEQFHEMAERVRAGEHPYDVERSMRPVEEDEDLLGTYKSDGEVKREGEPLPPIEGEKEGTKIDPDAKKEAPPSDPDATKVGMQGDPIKPADEAIKPA